MTVQVVETAGQAEQVAFVSLYEKTHKIYPRAVTGWFAMWRWALVAVTQLVFYGTPWLTWNDRQAVLFDLATRRFYIFGLVLYPQDFIFLTALLIISAYGLFLFTALAGRLWCGYACPQTVYTEIFLGIERFFEGDRPQRMKRDAAAWTMDGLLRKSGKQVAWVTLSLWTGFTFVGYFTPVHTLLSEAVSLVNLGAPGQAGLGPWEWFWVLFYSFATYGNAGHMREQVCKYMCPYARFQSAMFDKDTLIISYDAERGEPRGLNAQRGRKGEAKPAGVGDCIDCGLCVQVCPTGIDIRQGLQYECIGCTACIDVCDGVMDKMAYPRGLVRYATQNGLAAHWTRAQMFRRALRPRVLVYTGILVLIVAALGAALWLRAPFRVDVVRDRGTLSRVVDDGFVENVYRLQVMNATEQAQHYHVVADGSPDLQDLRVSEGAGLTLGPAEARWIAVSLRLPPEVAARAGSGAHTVHFDVVREPGQAGEDREVVVREKTTFMIPR